MTGNICHACSDREYELSQLKAENGNLQQVVRLMKRIVNDVKFETAENMSTLDIDQATRLLVLEALDRVNGDRAMAAKMLGVARSTLFLYLKKFQITDTRVRVRMKK